MRKKRVQLERDLECLASFSNQELWHQWMTSSGFMLGCMKHLSVAGVTRLLDVYPPIQIPLAISLGARMGEWTSDDVRKVRAMVMRRSLDVRVFFGEEGEVDVFDAELKRLEDRSDLWAKEAEKDGGTPDTARRSFREGGGRGPSSPEIRGAQETERGEEGRAGDDGERQATGQDTEAEVGEGGEDDDYIDLALRIHVRFFPSYDVHVIGSGCFQRGNDLDLVVCIPNAETLEVAYDIARAATGWTPCFTTVGEHVAVLCGVVEGVKVDLQVWRGEVVAESRCRWRDGKNAVSRSLFLPAGPTVPAKSPMTPAEGCTQRALHLTRTLACDSDALFEWRARVLHRWFDASACKGQAWGRVSGIGVTCLAACFPLHDADPSEDARATAGMRLLPRLLGRISSLLMCMAPHLSVGEAYDGVSPDIERPKVALQIMFERTCLTDRMTSATTRHLLDVVTRDASLAASGHTLPLGAASYEQWRTRTMVVAAHVSPTAASTTTHASVVGALSALDGHPAIDTVHVDEGGGGAVREGVVRVRCSLRSLDVDRYGFQDGDVVEEDQTNPWRVWAKRGLRARLPVYVSPVEHTASPVAESFASASTTCHVIRTPSCDGVVRYVPNLPHLSVDVARAFGASWELA